MGISDMDQQKTNFYSPDEYLMYQKSLLKKELKTVIRKSAQQTIENFQASLDAQYSLYYRQRVKKFFALSYSKLIPPGEEESKIVDKKASKLPQIRDSDLVLAFPSDSVGQGGFESKHMLCVVDSIQAEENQIILKIVLRETNPATVDQRTRNLMRNLSEGSTWTLLKLCNLENFNRSYVGYDQFQICNLHTSLLNLSASVNNAQSSFPLAYDAASFPDAGFPLNAS